MAIHPKTSVPEPSESSPDNTPSSHRYVQNPYFVSRTPHKNKNVFPKFKRIRCSFMHHKRPEKPLKYEIDKPRKEGDCSVLLDNEAQLTNNSEQSCEEYYILPEKSGNADFRRSADANKIKKSLTSREKNSAKMHRSKHNKNHRRYDRSRSP